MGFLGIGPLEFLLIFGVAMFFLGPRRLAEGVKVGRRYYTELKRYRTELTELVNEAIDAEDLRRDLEDVRRDTALVAEEVDVLRREIAIDQGELNEMMSIPSAPTVSKADLVKRGDGKIDGEEIPDMGLEAGKSRPAPGPSEAES